MTDTDTSLATLFDVLSHARRRSIILAVACAPAGVQLRTVAEFQYAIEHDVTPTAAATRSVTILQTNLKRSHLEPLEAAGCITRSGDRLHAGPTHGWALALIAVGALVGA
ncbi:hypothetical protein DOS48_05140 [Halorubrum sp. PV6]|nr:hypothetical protein DOS48_05140 [Halorubrum sp. PV6]